MLCLSPFWFFNFNLKNVADRNGVGCVDVWSAVDDAQGPTLSQLFYSLKTSFSANLEQD